MNDATPNLTPAEWLALSPHEQWGTMWGEVGHLHNLLDLWAEDATEVERQLRADITEYHNLVGRLSFLLTGVANALKGDPPENVWHDWSDLPALARELQHQRDLLGDLLGRVLVKLGVVTDMPMTGPQLMLAAETLLEVERLPEAMHVVPIEDVDVRDLPQQYCGGFGFRRGAGRSVHHPHRWTDGGVLKWCGGVRP